MLTALMMTLALPALGARPADYQVCSGGVSSASLGVARTLSLLELSLGEEGPALKVRSPSRMGLTLKAPAFVAPSAAFRFSPLRPLLKLGLRLELLVGTSISTLCGLDVGRMEMPWVDMGVVTREPFVVNVHPSPPQLKVSIITALERMRALDPSDIPITVGASITTGVTTTLSSSGQAQVAAPSRPSTTTNLPTPSLHAPRIIPPAVDVRPVMPQRTEMTTSPRR